MSVAVSPWKEDGKFSNVLTVLIARPSISTDTFILRKPTGNSSTGPRSAFDEPSGNTAMASFLMPSASFSSVAPIIWTDIVFPGKGFSIVAVTWPSVNVLLSKERVSIALSIFMMLSVSLSPIGTFCSRVPGPDSRRNVTDSSVSRSENSSASTTRILSPFLRCRMHSVSLA